MHKKDFSLFLGDKLHCLFFTTANAYSEHVHNKAMEKIKNEKPKDLWARYEFDTDLKAPNNTINFMDNFNRKIEKYRHK